MKRAALIDLSLAPDDDGETVVAPKSKKPKSDLPPPPPPPRYASIEELAHALGLSVFMLGVLADMYDPRSGKFTATPRLIRVHFPNPRLHCFSEVARHGDKPLSVDDAIKSVLLKREKALKSQKAVLCGATDQSERLPAREIDWQMTWEFCGWAQTEWGYYIFAYYIGGSSGQEDVRNWRPVHRSHLACFHRRIRQVQQYALHTQNDQRAISQERHHACYDPRYIIHKWKKTTKDVEARLQILVANIDLLQRDDFLVTLDKRAATMTSPPSFDVEGDRAKQAARGFCITGDNRFCDVPIAIYPELGRSPLAKSLRFTIDDLVYLAQRLESADEWDPAVLMRAIIIALNHEAHIARATTEVCDRHLLILERDNAVPIIEHLLGNETAQHELKAAAEEYLLALMACDLASRAVPDALYKKIVAPSEKNLVLLNDDDVVAGESPSPVQAGEAV